MQHLCLDPCPLVAVVEGKRRGTRNSGSCPAARARRTWLAGNMAGGGSTGPSAALARSKHIIGDVQHALAVGFEIAIGLRRPKRPQDETVPGRSRRAVPSERC